MFFVNFVLMTSVSSYAILYAIMPDVFLMFCARHESNLHLCHAQHSAQVARPILLRSHFGLTLACGHNAGGVVPHVGA